MSYNRKQLKIIDEGVYHLKHGSNQIYEYGGFAGTGKSVVLNEIISRSGIDRNRIAPMAYIGQAAIIMRLKGFRNAKSAHSWLYHAKQGLLRNKDNSFVMNTYYNVPEMGIIFEPKELDNIDVIVIDEGYTIPMSMKHEIERRGKKMIVTGDNGQLPPVMDKPAYLVNKDIIILDEIMRQDKSSAIVYLADRARKGLPISTGLYGNVLVIEMSDLTDEMLINSCITICSKNKTREELNNRIRRNLGYTSITPNYGEKVICRKSNWNIDIDGIALSNGLIGTVVNHPTALDYDGNTFRFDFKPDLFDCNFNQLCCDYKYFTASHEEKKQLKNNRYAIGEKFEWGYCITTHLSQGAQYPYGIYIEEYLREDINNSLNYVGATRFMDYLIYVKQNRRYY